MAAAAACLFFSSSLIAAPPGGARLAGTVTGPDHGPLAGAVVDFPELHVGTVTDSAGRYQFADLPRGTHLLEVRYLGTNTFVQSVILDGVTEKNISLSDAVVERNEVVVTGTSLATERRRSPAPITSVRLRELQQNASTNVIDALTRLPGVTQLSTGPAISKPVIRGLGYNRIVTLADGVRQEGQQWGDEHGIEVDEYNLSRAEVLKGPASLAYGSDAIAGVVNLITDDPVPTGTIRGGVTANYQTVNGLRALHGNLAGNTNGLSWKLWGTGKEAHDYRNAYDGSVFNSRFRNANYGASVGLNKSWGYSRLSFSSFNQHLGLVEGDRDSATGRFVKAVDEAGTPGEAMTGSGDEKAFLPSVPAQRINHQKLVWSNLLHLDNGGRIGLTLGYQQNRRREYGDVLRPEAPGLHLLLQTLTYDARYYLPALAGWQLTAGVNGMSQRNENKGIEFLVPDYRLFDAGVYTLARRDIGAWSVSGGVRYDHRSLKSGALYLDTLDQRVTVPGPADYARFSAFDRNFGALTGSIGASYAASSKLTLRANAAAGYRAPNIAELAANGVHEGTIRYEYGGAGLSAERSIQADLGATFSSDHVLVDAALFYNRIFHYVYTRKLESVSGTDSIPAAHNDEGFAAFQFDQGDAALYGGELYVDLHPHPLDWLHLENTVSYVRGQFLGTATDSTRNLPMMPPLRWLVELRAQKTALTRRLHNAYVKVGLDVTAGQDNIFSAYGTETATPGYTLLNAGIGADFVDRRGRTLATVLLSGQNLGDVAYQNHLSRLKYAPVNYATGRGGVFNAGRNVSILVSVPLRLRG